MRKEDKLWTDQRCRRRNIGRRSHFAGWDWKLGRAFAEVEYSLFRPTQKTFYGRNVDKRKWIILADGEPSLLYWRSSVPDFLIPASAARIINSSRMQVDGTVGANRRVMLLPHPGGRSQHWRADVFLFLLLLLLLVLLLLVLLLLLLLVLLPLLLLLLL